MITTLIRSVLIVALAWVVHRPHSFAADVSDGVTHISQLEFQQDPSKVVIDVRTAREYARGHVPSAINIPHSNILADLSLLDDYKGKQLVFYCGSGGRVKRVTDFLNEAGYGNEEYLYHLKGDMNAWKAAGLPIE